jgi:hypothetical protein
MPALNLRALESAQGFMAQVTKMDVGLCPVCKVGKLVPYAGTVPSEAQKRNCQAWMFACLVRVWAVCQQMDAAVPL